MQSVPHPKRVLGLLGELHSAKSTGELAGWAVNVLAHEMGCEFAVLTGFGPKGEMRNVTLADGIDPGLLPIYGPVIASHIDQDLPGLRWMVENGTARYTGRITDLVSQSQFDETAPYNEAYPSLQMRRILGTIFRTPDGGMLSLALGRDGRDFSDGQTETLRIVSQHLEVAMGRLLQIETLSARRQAGEDLARFEAVREGSQWFFTAIDEASTMMLSRNFGEPDGFKPPRIIQAALELARSTTSICALDGSRWIASLSYGTDRRVMIQIEREHALSATLHLLDGLTLREREVLGWMAQGKRDAEIAVILGIAPRTASKHVEHILSKLSCETRAAAAVMYLQK